MAESQRLCLLTALLNLPEFKVVHEQRLTPSDPVQFTVIPQIRAAVCLHCGRTCTKVNRTNESKLKDLPLGEQSVELIVRTYQFECEHCESYFTPHFSCFAPGAHATQRFLVQIARWIAISDIANVARMFGIPERTLGNWYYDHIERQMQQPSSPDVKPIKCLGIDELSLKKNIGSSSAS